jgi:hypothetical protein
MKIRLGMVCVYVLTLAIGAMWLRTSRTPPCPVCASRENFDRIENGMTRREVEEILGGQPGKYLPANDYMIRYDSVLLPQGECQEWTSADGQIVVGFDEEGKVQDKQRNSVLLFLKPTLLEQIRSFVGW